MVRTNVLCAVAKQTEEKSILDLLVSFAKGREKLGVGLQVIEDFHQCLLLPVSGECDRSEPLPVTIVFGD